MEITTELLQTIRERVEQVFRAKIDSKLDKIELSEGGTFFCSYTHFDKKVWDVVSSTEEITALELSSDLDEIVRIRKEKEELERTINQEKERIKKERLIRREKNKRMSDYKELRKEFDEKSEIDFAEWLSNNEWVKRNHTHPKHIGKYFSNIHCEYKEIGELYEMFKLTR